MSKNIMLVQKPYIILNQKSIILEIWLFARFERSELFVVRNVLPDRCPDSVRLVPTRERTRFFAVGWTLPYRK